MDAGSLADSTSSQQLRAPGSLFAQMGEMRRVRPISQAKGLENQAVHPTKGKVWVYRVGTGGRASWDPLVGWMPSL